MPDFHEVLCKMWGMGIIMMDCPICKNEMKRGKIGARGGAGLYWLPDEENISFIAGNSVVEKHKGIVLVDANEIRISREAFICEACRKIMVDY